MIRTPSVTRRHFLHLSAAAAAGVVLAPRGAHAADARVEILLNERIGPVTADLYGHFVEHLGGVVYDGVWVGEKSKVPNTGGIRQALIDHMRRLPPGAIRWPGGCFADSYDWRDGIGSADRRPTRTNFWVDEPSMLKRPDGPWKQDPNTFGTNEFARLCRLAGGAPYFAANLRSLPAKDFYQWIEYCNAPAGTNTLANMRAAAGDRDPFKVRYWGVGNESWGCGGEFTPEEYATEYRRFTAWAPRFGVDLAFIGSGPNSADLGWSRRFFTKLLEKGEGQLGRMWGWGLHHYSWNTSRGATTDWFKGKGDAVKFSNDEWYELLNESDRMEGLITGHWAVMGELDRRHRVKLVVDEWGAWYREGSEVDPSHLLGQQSTMRDARSRGADARHVSSPRRQGRHGEHRAARQLPSVAVPGARGQVPRDTHIRRVRDVRRTRGRRVGAGGILGAPDPVSAGKRNRLDLGAGGICVDQGQDADGHAGQPARQRAASRRDRGARRGRCLGRRPLPWPPPTFTRTTPSNSRAPYSRGSRRSTHRRPACSSTSSYRRRSRGLR